MTRFPSVTGDAAQYGLLSFIVSSGNSYTGPAVQRTFPFCRSTHINARRLPIACVTKTRSSQTIGEEFPGPGNFTRQTMLFVALHEIGKSFSSVSPFPCGPRHCGQFDAETPIDCAATAINANS